MRRSFKSKQDKAGFVFVIMLLGIIIGILGIVAGIMSGHSEDVGAFVLPLILLIIVAYFAYNGIKS